MLDEMTPDQFIEWQAKDIVEPIGHRGTHEILSLFASMVARMMGNKIDPESFMYWKEKPESSANQAQQLSIMALQAIGAKRG